MLKYTLMMELPVRLYNHTNFKSFSFISIIDGVSLGFVTFGTGILTQNRTVVFPVVDNNIALEPDKHYLLRLRNIGNIGLGNPGTMNVTVEDDDGK